MRFSILLLALAAESTLASSWFTKAAYNKWHETELERWLSDHNVPYPTPSDRKDLLDLVKNSWEENVARPYNYWDTTQLQKYLSSKGTEVQKSAENNKESLVDLIKSSWTETADQASDSYANAKDWVFDSWTDSQLKAFLDYNKIPNPTPRTRDSLLYTVRSNYQAAADKLGEAAAYPGNWIYESWSDSDLKAFLDERGIPVPQPNKRDSLIASVRRNARLAGNSASTASVSLASAASSLSASAVSAQASVTDELINAWSESQLKAWADKNGIKVPQGSRVNELRALVRKERARLFGDNVSYSASSAYGAATTKAGNAFAQATNDIYDQGKEWYDWAAVQIGIGSEEAKKSISSISSAASSYASSVSSVADKSASVASKSAVKVSGDANAAMSSARAQVAKSASSASRVASVSAKAASVSVASASAKARNEL